MAEQPTAPDRRPAMVARQLALAHWIQRAIESGEVKYQADAARLLGLSRARVSQLLDLMLLAPDIQERLLPCGRSWTSASGPPRRYRRTVLRATPTSREIRLLPEPMPASTRIRTTTSGSTIATSGSRRSASTPIPSTFPASFSESRRGVRMTVAKGSV